MVYRFRLIPLYQPEQLLSGTLALALTKKKVARNLLPTPCSLGDNRECHTYRQQVRIVWADQNVFVAGHYNDGELSVPQLGKLVLAQMMRVDSAAQVKWIARLC
jgi:hypothetical protein